MRPELARGADGPIIEGFVLAELIRQSSYAPDSPWLAHHRDRNTAEVDVIVEAPDGRLAAIEVKAGAGASPATARHLAAFRNRLFSLPIGELWR